MAQVHLDFNPLHCTFCCHCTTATPQAPFALSRFCVNSNALVSLWHNNTELQTALSCMHCHQVQCRIALLAIVL